MRTAKDHSNPSSMQPKPIPAASPSNPVDLSCRNQLAFDSFGAVAKLAGAFTKVETTDALDRLISEVLGELGRIFTFARIHYFQFSDDFDVITCAYEWCAAGIASEQQKLQNITLPQDLWWKALMDEQCPVQVSDLAELFQQRPSEMIPHGDSISYLCLAVFGHHGKMIGFLAFCTEQQIHTWPEEQRAVLQMLTEVIGSTTSRIASDHALRKEHNRLSEILENTLSGYWDWDMVHNLQYLSQSFRQLLGDTGHVREDTSQGWQAGMFREDLICALGALDQHLKSRGKVAFNMEVRYRHREGTTIWVILTGSVVAWSPDGLPLRMIGSIVDITARKQMEMTLRETNEKLQAAIAQAHAYASQANASNQAKTEFIARMSHELRTPLNGVIGMLGLQLATSNPAKQRQYAQVAQSSANTLLSIINEILDFSKIEAGRIELDLQDFDITSLLKSVLASMEIQASSKQLTLTCTIASDVPVLLKGDPMRVRQALTNLIANAIKFTEQGHVRVDITKEDPSSAHRASVQGASSSACMLRFAVSDTGIGIPPDKQNRLFEKFSQVDGSMTRKYGGTGLGLVITKQLAALMDGEVDFTSAVGQGSTFWFTACFDAGKREENTDEDLDLAAYKNRFADRGARILIAEDNITNQDVVVGVLEMMGVEADVANNGQGAVDAAQQKHYDAILMDIQMPEMDGLEATRIIRQQETSMQGLGNSDLYPSTQGNTMTLPSVRRVRGRGKVQHVPIIALTAHVMQGQREQFMAAGMDDYLPKPIQPNALVTMLTKWL